MSVTRTDLPQPAERPHFGALAVCLLALSLALPAAAADEKKQEAANWTVFLTSGSSIAATRVHHDEETGRYVLTLKSGGQIQLSERTVKRVSRDAEDRVEKPAAMVATSTGAPKAGPVPGSIDTSEVKPQGLRSPRPAITPTGETLKERTEARRGTIPTNAPADASRGRRPANEERLTPKRGMMEKMLRRANMAPRPHR